MNDLIDINKLFISNDTSVELLPTLFSFLMCVLMSFIVRDFYIKRSFSLTGKMHIGSIIPVLSAVVFLVIVVVKSSLALSLGLVGALSIVRFRTPIKEPEELVFLFMAIGVGLGTGAGQTKATAIVIFLTLLIYYVFSRQRYLSKDRSLGDWLVRVQFSPKVKIDEVISQSDNMTDRRQISRLSVEGEHRELTMYVVMKDDVLIGEFTGNLEDIAGVISVSVQEQNYQL